jgi:hypothetical protein
MYCASKHGWIDWEDGGAGRAYAEKDARDAAVKRAREEASAVEPAATVPRVEVPTPTPCTLRVFDFDGVLVVPFTDPEEFATRTWMGRFGAYRDAGDLVAVVSKNPRAYPVLKPLVTLGVIYLRARSVDKWWEATTTNTYEDGLHGASLSKADYIHSILAEIRQRQPDKNVNHIVLVDDDMDNIREVAAAFPNATGRPGDPVPTTPSFSALFVPSMVAGRWEALLK